MYPCTGGYRRRLYDQAPPGQKITIFPELSLLVYCRLELSRSRAGFPEQELATGIKWRMQNEECRMKNVKLEIKDKR